MFFNPAFSVSYVSCFDFYMILSAFACSAVLCKEWIPREEFKNWCKGRLIQYQNNIFWDFFAGAQDIIFTSN
jgi:hypothetical protein